MLRRVTLVRIDVSEEFSASIKYKIFLRNVLWLLVTANVPSSPILVTLMMEALSSSYFEANVAENMSKYITEPIRNQFCSTTFDEE
jgi:hypothetical protein